jgi:hypothetical protein
VNRWRLGEDAEYSTVILLEVLPRNVGCARLQWATEQPLMKQAYLGRRASNFRSVSIQNDGVP